MEYRVDERAKRIARKLRKIRELKGLTREKFCEPLGENSDYWGLIERGEQPISLPKLLQVCEVYQIPIESVVVLDYQVQDNGRVREENISAVTIDPQIQMNNSIPQTIAITAPAPVKTA